MKKHEQLIVEDVSTEREIAEIQLERLKQIARERLLSYEETKIYDLLTKNLLLSKGKPTTFIETTAKSSDRLEKTATEDLLKIAQTIKDADIIETIDVVENDKSKDPPSDN